MLISLQKTWPKGCSSGWQGVLVQRQGLVRLDRLNWSLVMKRRLGDEPLAFQV